LGIPVNKLLFIVWNRKPSESETKIVQAITCHIVICEPFDTQAWPFVFPFQKMMTLTWSRTDNANFAFPFSGMRGWQNSAGPQDGLGHL
jgi:hypothetical protein